MTQEELIKFNAFRQLCLTNSEVAIRTAEELQNKSVNHIAFHLAVFCLEEIGKVFVGWFQFNAKETWGKDHYNIPIDDHKKKYFGQFGDLHLQMKSSPLSKWTKSKIWHLIFIVNV